MTKPVFAGLSICFLISVSSTKINYCNPLKHSDLGYTDW